MRAIEILDQKTIDKIAAGEVVERPASVVKELVENAIDARATAITVEIKEGGISFIRITDNGCGITKDQVRLAFLRHATSKIRNVEDLVQIASLGFRGEALSSISAVSQVELITKTPESLTGVRYCIEGGTEKELEEIGAPSGTTFLVHHLFYNTPARAKFLKSATAEGNSVSTVVEQLALSHPEISFKYIQNGQNKLYTSGNGNLKEIVYQIYGRDLTRELIAVEAETPLMKISGFIGNPSVARGNRNFENYFVNGRYVKSKLLARAIEDAYHGFMMQHRYPFTLLYLEIDGEKVDVNVHPSKMELRFSNQEELYHQLCLALQNALLARERIPEVSLEKEESSAQRIRRDTEPKREQAPEPFERMRRNLSTAVPQLPVRRPEHVTVPDAREVYGGQTVDAGIQVHTAVPDARESIKGADGYLRREPAAPEPGALLETSALYKSGNRIASIDHGAAGVTEAFKASGTFGSSALTAEKTGASDGRPIKEPAAASPAPAQEMSSAGSTGSSVKAAHAAPHDESEVPEGKQIELFSDRLLSAEARKNHRIIGQVFDTYWLVEYQHSLYIIDQHAAHEKVLYERMMKEYHEKQITSQMLCPPMVISLSAREQELLKRYLEDFRKFGYEIEEFGGKEYKICAVPANLYRVKADQLFTEILDRLEERGEQSPDLILERLASMSCKAAVKGNQSLSRQEAESLIDELLSLENPYNCPHGRPTIISMSRYELDKKFKRIL